MWMKPTTIYQQIMLNNTSKSRVGSNNLNLHKESHLGVSPSHVFFGEILKCTYTTRNTVTCDYHLQLVFSYKQHL
jgi:hypothetical protein